MAREPVRSDAEALARLQARPVPPSFQGLGFRYTQVDLREGLVRAELDPSDDFRNQGGGVHGGMLSFLADILAGAGVIASIGDEDWCATLELNISYLRRLRRSPVTGVARAVRRGARVHVWEVEFFDAGGKLGARARVSFLVNWGGPV